MTRHDFKLSFATDRGALLTVNVPHADATATGPEVAKAMKDLIDSGIVYAVSGKPVAAHSAELVKTTNKDFNVA